MEKTLGSKDARNQFRDLLDDVQQKGTKYVISRNGKPAVAIVPLSVYSKWQKDRDELIETIQKLRAANADMDSNEVMDMALEAQKEVRNNALSK